MHPAAIHTQAGRPHTITSTTMESINQIPGAITGANESRFNAAHYSEALTAFTVGWRDPEDLSGLLDFIAPAVPVGRRFEFKRANNAEAFYSETDDVRAIGSGFKRVEYSGETVQEKTLNKGLTIRIDHDEISTDDWEERTVQILLQRLYRNDLRRAVAALEAAAQGTNATWGSTGRPDADVRAMLIAASNDSGIRPNRLLFGEGAWDLRASAYESQENAGAIAGVSFTPAELARKLFVQDVRVISTHYQSTPSAKALLADKAVYAYYGNEALSKDEPSNLKRFITPTEGGKFRVYLDQHAKYTDLTVEHYSSIVVTSALGVRKLSVSAS